MINTSENRVTYLGDGNAKVFPISFPFLNREDIQATLVDEDNNTKILTSDYYIDIEAKTLTYPGYPPGEEKSESEQPAILKKGEKLVIKRDTALTQLSTLGDVWPFDVTEDGLDKLTMIAQDMKDNLNRTIHLDDSTDLSSFDVTLPHPKNGYALIWSEGRLTNADLSTATEEAASLAKGYADNAKISAANSEASAQKSKDSETAAAESASAASDSASKAKEEADESSTHDASAKSSAVSAALSDSSATNALADIKKIQETLSEQQPKYDSTVSYSYPQTVAYTDGYTYRCIGENIKGENPDTSSNWVCLTNKVDDFFELDEDGNIIPTQTPTWSHFWELDGNGNIEPKEVI